MSLTTSNQVTNQPLEQMTWNQTTFTPAHVIEIFNLIKQVLFQLKILDGFDEKSPSHRRRPNLKTKCPFDISGNSQKTEESPGSNVADASENVEVSGSEQSNTPPDEEPQEETNVPTHKSRWQMYATN